MELPTGTIYKNSAKPINNFRYNHPFDGHGYINAIKVNPNGFEYRGIRVKTMNYNIEKTLDTKIFRGLGTNVDYNPLFLNNFSNISVFHYDEELYSMSEGGVPYKIEKDGTATSVSPFLQCLPYFPMTPHPKTENVNGAEVVYNASGYNAGLTLFNNHGVVFNELFPNNETYYFHDFHITPKYYVFYLNRMTLDLFNMYTNRKTIVESIQFQEGNKVLLVNRDTFERSYIDAPDMNCLHIAKCDDTPTGVIMYAALIKDLNLSVEHPYDFENCNLHKMTVCVEGLMTHDKLLHIDAEMPKAHGDVIYLMNKNALVKVDTETNVTNVVDFGDQVIEEPVVDDSSGTVFVIGHTPNKTHVTAFDDSLRKITEHTFDFETSYGLHGIFV